jgi:VCBS repeat-containing protein
MANDDRRSFSRDDFDRDDDRDNRRTQVIRGTNGNDLLIGTSGNDNISGSRGDDIIHAGAGNDRVRGDDGNDTLYGDGGNDALDGGRGNDVLLGGSGNDDLDGGDGNDLMFGDDGNDDIRGGQGDDVAFGGTGNDELEGGDGNDTLSGDDGNDELEGGKGNDILAGGAGDDKLEGDEGNDVLTGGAGNDDIDGGKGFDVAAFSGNFDDYRIIVARDGRGGGGNDDREGRETRLTVIDVRSGSPDGTDRLENIEALQFADRTIYLDGRNNGPMARADALATSEDTRIIIPASRLTGNDSDFDGDRIRITAVGGAVNASVALDAAGNIVITPAANFSGTATFTYTLTDARGGTDTGSVTVNVSAVADAPSLNAGNVTGNEDSSVALNIAAALTDLDGSESLKVIVSGVPAGAHLSAGVNNGNGSWTLGAADLAGLTITPSANSDADFTLSVKAIATESSNGSSAETVRSMTVTINAVADAPVVSAANVSGNEDGVIGLDLSAALTDTDGSESLTAVKITGVPAGAALSAGTHNPDGSWSLAAADLAALKLIPDANFNGVVNLQVTVGSTESSNGSTAATTQSFTVTVVPVNDAPVIAEGPQSGATTEDGALTAGGQFTASDVDDGATQVWSVNGGGVGSYGSLSVDSSGAWTYTLANGTANVQALAAGESHVETFTVRVTDDAGATDERSVSITINGSNDGPVITGSATDASGAAIEESALTASGQLTASDADTGATQAWSIVGSAAGTYGSLAVHNQTGAWTYTLANDAANVQALAAGESHVESFTVRVTDDQGATAEQTVNVIVRGTNDSPVAVADTGAQYNDVVQSFDVLANDSDVDAGDTRHVVAASVPAGQGSVSIVNDRVVFDPGQDFHTLRRDEVAQVTITYTIADAADAQSTSTLTLDVIGTNTPPVAHDVSATGNEDGVINGALAATDDDNDPLTYAIETGPQNGNVVVHADGTYTYTPGANYNGTDTFTYKVTDTSGESSIATVALTVNAVNDGPQAVVDSASTNEDVALVISAAQLLANDTDIDAGDTTTLVSVQDALHGTVSFDGTSATFIPDADYNGPASFTYTMVDSAGATSTASVSLTVNAMNDAPVAFADSGNTDEDISLVVSASDLLANDTDVDAGDTKTLVSVQGAAHGTVSFDGTNVTFVPDADYNGPASFSYTMADSAGATSTATVNLAVNAANDVPVAIADSATTDEDIALVISPADLLANDTDVDSGDSKTLLSVQEAAHGTVSFNGTHVTFVPDADYNGPASFSYTMRDAAGAMSTATVNLTVNAQNDTPVAVADSAVTNEDTSLVISAADLLANDTDIDTGDTKTLVSVQGATHGAVSFNGSDVTFIPDADYNGPASFTYTMVDSAGAISTTTVNLLVDAVNDAPVAVTDIVTASEDSVQTLSAASLLANDTDVDSGDTKTLVSVQDATHGTVSLSGGTVSFLADPNYNGPASFTYTMRDAAGELSTATVNVTVSAVNDAPVAVNDSASTNEDTPIVLAAATLLANDFDVDDGDAKTIVSVQDAMHGTVNLSGSNITFAPTTDYNGLASFTYTIRDSAGETSTATVNLAVHAVNDAPVAANDSLSAIEDTSVTFTAAQLLDNDTDVDGPRLGISGVSAGTGGTVALNSDGTITFTPDSNFFGTASFGYTATDGIAVSNGATVQIAVVPVNDPPTMVRPAGYTYTEDATLSLSGISVADIDSAALSVSLTLSSPMAGQLNTATAGSVTSTYDSASGVWTASGATASVNALLNGLIFTPASNFNSSFAIVTSVSDGVAPAVTGSLSMAGIPVNDLPVILSNGGGAAAAASVAENTTAVTTVIATDPDAGTTLVYGIAGGADSGKFTINAATGILSFVSAPNFEAPGDAGLDNVYDVTVQASDGQGGIRTQTIAVTVTNVNEAPVITSLGAGATASISVAEGASTVTTVTSTDPDAGATKTFSISGGADAGKFVIGASTGVLSFAAPPNFEVPTDAGGNNVYDVDVRVSDGSLADTQSIAVSVTNVNEPAVFTSSPNINVAENQTAVTTVQAVDPDAGTTLSFSIAGGLDAGKFNINAATGVLSFITAPNYEAPDDVGGNRIYNLNVQASDGNGGVTTQAISVNITNVNEAPVITSNGGGDAATISLTEGATTVTTITSTDQDAGATRSFALSGADAAKFSINASTGVLSFVAAPDFENPGDAGGNNVYDVNVVVSDGSLSDSQSLAITVLNGPDAPIINSNGGGTSAVIALPENSTTVTTVSATDPDGSTVTYAISGGVDASKFTIDAATGALSFIAAPNFEAPADFGSNNIYDVIVSASDGVLIDTQALSVSITNVNEAPVITSNGGGTSANLSFTTGSADIVTTVITTDQDAGATRTLSLSGADAGRFSIDAGGNLRFMSAPNNAVPLDTNQDNIYEVTVTASDGTLTDSQALSVRVGLAGDDAFSINAGATRYVLGTDGRLADVLGGVYGTYTGTGGTAPVSMFGTPMARNDDGAQLISLDPTNSGKAFNLTLGNASYNQLYLDNNGLISFQGPVYSWDGTPFPLSYGPLIAPFWSDVDTRGAVGTISTSGALPGLPGSGNSTGSNLVYWNIGAGGVMTFTWDDVGRYPADSSGGVNAFQLQLIPRDGATTSGFAATYDAVFRYESINWLRGSASSTDPQAGYDLGDGVHYYSLPDSHTAQMGNLESTSNVGVMGIQLLQNIGANGQYDGGTPVATGTLLANDKAAAAGQVVRVVGVDGHAGAQDNWITLDSGARLMVMTDGQYLYTAPSDLDSRAARAGDILHDSFTYTIQAYNNLGAVAGTTDTATVWITINGAEDAPVANIDNASVTEDAVLTATGNVLANDVDYDRGSILHMVNTGTVTVSGTYGSMTLLSNGQYTYTLNNASATVQALNNGQTLTDTLSYQVADETGLTSQGRVVVTINGVTEGYVAPSTPITNTTARTSTGDGDYVTLREDGVAYGFAGGILSGFNTATATNKLMTFGTTTGRIDDGYQYVNLSGTGFSVDALGRSYDGFYVNANGSISFDNGISRWTAPNSTLAAMIAPFWADVDTRNAASGLVYASVDESGKIATITWDHVGYFNTKADKLDTFQVQLIDRGDGGFDTLFHYGPIDWNQADSMSPAFQYPFAGVSAPGNSLGILPGSSTQLLDIIPGNTGYTGQWALSTAGTAQAYDTSGADASFTRGLLANDGATGAAVVAINGNSAAVGSTITLASHALLTVYADGSYIYRPSHAFDTLGEGQSGSDSFSYTYNFVVGGVTYSDSATVNLTILGNGENDVINGTAASETLTGGPGNNIISGAAGNDVITGAGGQDSLSGGTGADTLTGGAGRDVFVFHRGETGVDTITDFTAGSGGDALDIRDLLANYTPASSIGSFVRLDAAGADTNVMIDADGAGSSNSFVQVATLQGVTGLLLNDLLANQNLLAA